MTDHLATAQRYRLRAAETRKLALTIEDPKNRAVVEKAADDYDNMANAEENGGLLSSWDSS